MNSKKNEIHPVTSVTSIESHLKKDIVILKEDIRGVDDAFAFILAFLAFLCLLTIDGTVYSFGLFDDVIQKQFKVDYIPLILLPGSLTAGIYHIVAPLADTIMSGKQKLRVRAASGALLAAISSLGTAFITNYYAFTVVFGILVGIGFGLLFIPCVAIVSAWFVNQKPFGIGIAHAGTGFGIFIFSQFMPSIPDHFKFQGHFIGISVLCVLCFFATFLFKKPEKFLSETIQEKTLKNQKEMINQLKIEEKLRMENIILNNILALKKIQNDFSSCLFDGMVLTIDNELIKVTTSTSALYDQPCLTTDQINQIAEIVMQKIQSEKDDLSDINSEGLKEIVRDYIQSKLVVNNPSVINLREEGYGINDNISINDQEIKEIIIASNSKDIDKKTDKVNLSEEPRKSDFIQSNLSMFSNQSVCNLPNFKPVHTDYRTKNENIPLKLWNKPTFLLMIFSTMIAGLEILTPYYFIPLYLKYNNINQTDTALIVSMMGIFNVIGRVFSEIYVEKISGKISNDDCLWFHNSGLFISSISLLFLPFLINYYRIFGLFSCIHSMSIVFSNSIKISLVLDYLGIEALTTTYTYMLLIQGLSLIIGPPLHGLLFEFMEKNFLIVFYTMSGLLGFSAFLCCFIKCAFKFENKIVLYFEDCEAGMYSAENPVMKDVS